MSRQFPASVNRQEDEAEKHSAFDWLRCPSCHSRFSSTMASPAIGIKDYDIVVCRCSQYPVVAGIPILQKGIIGTARQTADEVISLLRAGRHQEALLSMIMPRPPAPPALAPSWIKTLPSIKGINRFKALTHAWFLRGWRQRTAALLGHPRDEVTAFDLLGCYFLQSAENIEAHENFRYLAFRFSQPRHLVGLSFMNLIHRPERPILDLCCGFGHMTHSLARRSGGAPVIGLDRRFFGLYVAKTRIAPGADYICADASQPLPFPERAFSMVLCVDGFQLVENKAGAIQEIKRVTHGDGLIMLVALRNARIKYPYPGDSLPPEGNQAESYQALVADMPHCLVADNDVLAQYLRLKGPPLAHSANPKRLANESQLSVVASHRRDVFRDHGFFPDWPHAEGRLRLNPLFVQEGSDERGKCRLRCAFPSAYYERDNLECKRYLPEEVFVDAEVLKDVEAGKRTPAMEPLIRQCVVLGMPERY